jgi:hypothetical protein
VVHARKVVFRNEAHQDRSAEYSGRRGQLFGPSCSLTNTLSHTRAAAVLVDEFDACGFECAPNDIQGRATRLTNPRFKLMRTWYG